MDREMIDILTFGACLGALARTVFGWRIDLHWCVAIGAGVVYTAHRGFDVAHLLSFLPPHAIEAGAALYFGSILVNWVRTTPSRDPRCTPRRLA